jgi:hypothetical protein
MTEAELEALIAEGDPLTPPDWTLERERQRLEQRERVRRRCVTQYSTSPLYRARAARNPRYWDTFYVGVIK